MALEDNAKKRIEYIAKRQELLASAVNSLQASLYESVLKNFDKIADDPAVLNLLWQQFQVSQHAKVLQKFAVDVMQIGKMNAEYFEEIAADLDSKDYQAIKKNANEYLMNRFGLSANGKAAKDGFLDTFVKDQSILRDLKQYAYKAQNSGIGVEEFKEGFKDMIVGTEAKNGSLMRYYQTFAFDTYQQADATIQDFYAKKLELEAALYLGGEISGTRPFCHERNGKVFLRSEIETWRGLKFQGRPANYDPFQDRGGYNCRHHFNWITNKMAVARRSDLEIGTDGKLRIKGASSEAKPAEIAKVPEASGFKPAASIKEAEDFAKETFKLKDFEKFGAKTKGVDYSSFSTDLANNINQEFARLNKKYGANVKSINGNMLNSNSNGQAGLLSRELKYNARLMNDVDLYSKKVKNDINNAASIVIDESNYKFRTITHEYGHLVAAPSRIKQYAKESVEIKNAHQDWGKITNDLYKKASAEDRRYMGDYSRKNDDELFAEAFTNFELSEKPNEWSIKIMDWYKKHEKAIKKLNSK